MCDEDRRLSKTILQGMREIVATAPKKQESLFKGLVMGRIVRVNTARGAYPAIVTSVLDKTTGLIDLQVFFTREIEAWQEIAYSEAKEIGCWHWPPREE